MKNRTHHHLLLTAFLVIALVVTACTVLPAPLTVAGDSPINTPAQAPESPDTDNLPPTSPTPQPVETFTDRGEEVLSTDLPYACTAPAELTPPMTEGPFYTPNTPERQSLLEDGVVGERLLLFGYVLDQDCQPVAGAFLDFWQADRNGVYDNAGYRMRGHQFSDESGFYMLETVLPGEYPGRTPHIHVKVQAPGGAMLTSQLFFPGAAGNTRDRIFDERLLVTMERTSEVIEAFFIFVVSRD